MRYFLIDCMEGIWWLITTIWGWINSINLMPVVAVIMVYIAWQQLRTNQRKVNLELYDRRYIVYQGVMDFLAALEEDHYEGGVDTDAAVKDFIKKTISHHFLFKPDVDEFRDDLIKRAETWKASSDDEKKPLLKHWFKEAPKIFRRYLDFTKL